jgi:hypothetical protein
MYSFSLEAPLPPERRSSARQRSIYRIGVLIVGSRRELCLIRNISAGGVMLHAHVSLSEAQSVAVEFKADAQVTGTVSWTGETNIGVRFDEPIDVEKILASGSLLDKSWQSRLPRIEINRMGILRVGAFTYGVNSRDISQGGIKLEVDHQVEIGSDVVLTLEGFRSIHGAVRWSGDTSCGISFNHLIPFRDLIDWIHQRGD